MLTIKRSVQLVLAIALVASAVPPVRALESQLAPLSPCAEIEACVAETLSGDAHFTGFSDPAGYWALTEGERTSLAGAFDACALRSLEGPIHRTEDPAALIEQAASLCGASYLSPASAFRPRQQPGECTGTLMIGGGANLQLKFDVCEKDQKSAEIEAKQQPSVRDELIKQSCAPLGCERLKCQQQKGKAAKECVLTTKPQTPKIDHDQKNVSCTKKLDSNGREIPCAKGKVWWECTVVIKSFAAFTCSCECK